MAIRLDKFDERVPVVAWDEVSVEFGAADADLLIPHSLTPSKPEQVDIQVLESSGPPLIYKDTSASRKAWGDGFIYLRSAIEGLKARLLLTVPLKEKQLIVGGSKVIGRSALPSELAYEDEANIFSQNQRINAGLGINVTPPALGELALSGGLKDFGRTVAAGVWQPYSIEWTASTTNPSIGNGALIGRYALLGQICFIYIRLTFGSSSNAGAGAWRFSLPFPASLNTDDSPMVARFTDNGTAHHLAVATRVSSTTLAVLNEGNTGSGIGAGIPIVWAPGDSVAISGFYEI